MILIFWLSFILFSHKFNSCSFSNFTFSNIFIFEISLICKYNIFNCVKFTFSKISISDILLAPKFKNSIFIKLTFSNTSISEISYQMNLNILIFQH